MPNTKISALTDGTTAQATDRIAVARSPYGSGDNRYITPSYIKTYLGIVGTLSVASGKTFTASNTLTLAGTDGTTMTFPGTSGTVATLNANNTYTGVNTFQPGVDGQAGTFRRNSSGQSANIIDIQTELNASLAYVDKNGGIGGKSIILTDAANPTSPTLSVVGGSNVTGTTLSGVQITGTAGEFSCSAASLEVGQTVTISGTLGGTGSITGYSNPTTYRISATNGSTTFTLVNGFTGAALTTTAGTPTGLTYTISASAYRVSQTWNNSNVLFTGLRLDVTDTASNSGSALLDFKVGGATRFRVVKDGSLLIGGSTVMQIASDSSQIFIRQSNLSRIPFSFRGSREVALAANCSLGWTGSDDNASGGTQDTFLWRDGASGVLALRNSTNAQTFRVYNTFTDTSNYERGFIQYNSNVLEIGHEAAGTGSQRILRFTSAITGANTAWEFRSSGSTAPRLVIAGTDRSVTVSCEVNTMINVVGGGYSSSMDYATGANSRHALRAVNSNASTIFFGLVGPAAGIMQLNNGTGRGDGYGASLEMWEMTAPSAPATNGVRIYAEDNGSGKTRLMALFPTGAAQQIAIEP